MTEKLIELARRLPKAELHLHIEGSLEPELIFALAQRNCVALPYASVQALKAAYAFTDLQSFLDLYYAGASVLLHEADFYVMAMAYFVKAHADGIVHAELFFDPQTHTDRGVPIAAVFNGLHRACTDAAAAYGVSSQLIMCFLRHLSEEAAFDTLEAARAHRHQFVGVGLDSSKVGHPPQKFSRVFAKARSLGLRVVAHAGEEGPPDYVWQALDDLKAQRIDHGVRSLEDAALVARLAQIRMPLTVCPLSNLKLCVVRDLREHPLKLMLELGLCVTVNSDDPAYFGGYLLENFAQCIAALNLDESHVRQLCANSIEASFMSDMWKTEMLLKLERQSE